MTPTAMTETIHDLKLIIPIGLVLYSAGLVHGYAIGAWFDGFLRRTFDRIWPDKA